MNRWREYFEEIINEVETKKNAAESLAEQIYYRTDNPIMTVKIPYEQKVKNG